MREGTVCWTSKTLVPCVLSVLAAMVLVSAQKPVVRAPVFVDYAPPPTTWSGLVSGAKVVIRGRIDDAQNSALTQMGRSQRTTEYWVRVVDVIKGDVAPGQLLTVLRNGGTTDKGGHIVQTFEPNFAPFQVGDTYVLFLNWNAAL